MSENKNPYFEALGVSPTSNNEGDLERLREAYDRAHDIRKFEIQMYWTRSAYLWTVQAAALGGLALVSSEFNSTTWRCADLVESAADECFSNRFRLLLVIAIWLFGAFSAYVWLLLLKGAKHWQNNWERHVDILEDNFSGALYKTYPVKTTEAPYSVSKLNELMAVFMLMLWLLLGSVSAILYLEGTSWVYAVGATFLSFFFFGWYFDSCLRMSDYPHSPSGSPVTGPPHIVVRRRAPDLTPRDTETSPFDKQ